MTGRFRVWDGETMHEPPHDYVLFSGGDVFVMDSDCPHSLRATNNDALFSTGLTEAAGDEVWEGDILEFEHYSGTVRVSVHWQHHKWQVFTGTEKTPESYPAYNILHVIQNDATVIGNRYEHDLLELADISE